MNDTQIKTLEQIRQFLNGVETIDLVIETKDARYAWIRETLTPYGAKNRILDFRPLHGSSN